MGRTNTLNGVRMLWMDCGGMMDGMSRNNPPTDPLTATLPPPHDVEATTQLPSTEDRTGASAAMPTIPGYELIGEIGRGGMGVVYRARQTNANRLVALKMVLSGPMASVADVQRFRIEVETVARMDHLNIVPVFEVGERAGVQFFSMKLIEGSTLADAIKARRYGMREFVRILATVARAVHHAHQRGVLHRDLKPGNVLLDADCTPYVTDFGLAKHVEGDGRLTQTGAVMGTPSYFAPEQARAEPTISTAADTYSLGAVLYEILTGRPPFVGGSPMDVVMQVIEQDPQAPRRLAPAVDKELEIICLKCLEKDPTKRYGSADALAADLDRWLDGEPIEARRVGQWEKAWRWCRRNPAIAGLAATLAVVSLAGLVVVSLLYVREQAQRGLAESNAELALRHLDEATRQQERTEASYRMARDAMENVLKIREDPRLQTGPLEDLQKQLAQAEATFYEKFLTLRGEDPAFQAERAKAFAALSSLSYRMGNMDEALRQINEAIAIDTALLTREPTNTETKARLAGDYAQSGTVTTKLGRNEETIDAHRHAVALYDDLVANDPENAGLIDAAATCHQNLGVAYRGAGRIEDGEKTLRAALVLLAKSAGDLPGDAQRHGMTRAIIWSNLAEFCQRLHHAADAAEAYQAALALYENEQAGKPDDDTLHVNTAALLNNYGLFLQDQRRLPEAADTWQKALKVFGRLVSAHPAENQYRHAMAMTHDNLGMLHARLGQMAEARCAYNEALKLWSDLHADNPNVIEYVSDLGCVQRNLGNLEWSLGNVEAARASYNHAIATLEKSPSRDQPGTNSHTWLRDALQQRAELATRQQRFADAIRDWDRVVEMEKGGRADTRLRRAEVLARAGETSRALGEVDFLADLPQTPAHAYYALARICAIASKGDEKQVEKAIQFLKQAQRASFFQDPTHLSALKADDDLKSLEKSPDYAAFLKDLARP